MRLLLTEDEDQTLPQRRARSLGFLLMVASGAFTLLSIGVAVIVVRCFY